MNYKTVKSSVELSEHLLYTSLKIISIIFLIYIAFEILSPNLFTQNYIIKLGAGLSKGFGSEVCPLA